jgi:N-acetylglutamate synthase-like GNAT family acetyltransferase
MLTFTTEVAPSEADVDAVDAGLHRYNLDHGRVGEVERVFVFARDVDGRVRGGAVGRRWGRFCELQQLWVDAPLRRAGVGLRLLAAFEAESARLGARTVYLDTFSFQAPAFYAKCGYAVVHAFEGFPHGQAKYTMQKELAASEGPP